MSDKKFIVGFPDGSGIVGGHSARLQLTSVTAYDPESEIYRPVIEVPVSDFYDCNELAEVIAAYLNERDKQ